MNVRVSDIFVDPADENGLLLGTYSKIDNLGSLHLSSHALKKVFDIYVDRVDPLVKPVHIPTLWTTLTSGLKNPYDVPKNDEALIFAFYLITIYSLEEHECHSLFGDEKSIIFARYRVAARQSLMNAGFLKTSSILTLQAFMMFIVSHNPRANHRTWLTNVDGHERMLSK